MNEEHSNTGSVPLIPLSRRRDYSRLSDDNDHFNYSDHHDSRNHDSNAADFDDSDTSYRGSSHHPHQSGTTTTTNNTMARGPLLSNLRLQGGAHSKKKGSSMAVMTSYAFDWIIIIATLGIAYWWNGVAPNRRPFSLEDPNIS